MVTDDEKQQLYVKKTKTASPIVHWESMMITSVINAKEERDVAITDIPGAFLSSYTDEDVIVVFCGQMVELIVDISRKTYERFVHLDKKGRKNLYLKLKKAMYRTLLAALIFWKNLSAQLLKWGYELNPYDPCVANKIVNGKQSIILWHVDDFNF